MKGSVEGETGRCPFIPGIVVRVVVVGTKLVDGKVCRGGGATVLGADVVTGLVDGGTVVPALVVGGRVVAGEVVVA